MSTFVAAPVQTRTSQAVSKAGGRAIKLRLFVLCAIPVVMTFLFTAHAWAEGCSPG